ncbi:hypothetical protein RND71_005167 [Anisodus tanguticus]|uniref:Uncharacterized protein n=1 Tax=Anisodus tanguticus TaxID=243964 RepID=A0AAE1SQY7_9SOLA|nr:hypothetical protein RND71_005167 [Anisodus tanguticus]
MDNTKASAQGPTSPAEGLLLRKIQELEARHAQLKHEMFKLTISDDHRSQRQRSHSISPQKPLRLGGGPAAVKNRTAEQLYGYSAEEALGQDPIELLAADARDFGDANNIVHQVKRGKSWTGLFPVKNK